MEPTTSTALRGRLRRLGLSPGAVDAAWPRWWSAEADASASARAELAFSVARRLGLDPGSLLEGSDAPKFIWREEAQFKGLSTETDLERAGITSFGRSVAAAAVSATIQPAISVAGATAQSLRGQLLAHGRPYVALADLLLLAWSIGVPVVHLRVFPWRRKRMAAMTVGLDDRWGVLLGKDSRFPAAIAFYLGHELAHIALRHIEAGGAIVDLEDAGGGREASDEEERKADEFAVELLTGDPTLRVLAEGGVRGSGSELARLAIRVARDLRIEPGTLAEAYGHSTGDWPVATDALRRIYRSSPPVWRQVNTLAASQLDVSRLPTDAADFLLAVLGDQVA